ncbi:hypothetical protein JXA84_07980 [candidate division WOR-3 bacterium]|nr:hypothetical protein [candidate division WOR-3 bacterium]
MAFTWSFFFFFLFAASSLGAVIHGIAVTENFVLMAKFAISLLITTSITLFVFLSLYYLIKRTCKFNPVFFAFLISLPAVLVSFFQGKGDIIIKIYQFASLMFSGSVFLFVFFKDKNLGATPMVIGVFMTIVSAAIQFIGSLSFRFFWTFDHNGIFHLIQLAGLVFVFAGAEYLEEVNPLKNAE